MIQRLVFLYDIESTKINVYRNVNTVDTRKSDLQKGHAKDLDVSDFESAWKCTHFTNP